MCMMQTDIEHCMSHIWCLYPFFALGITCEKLSPLQNGSLSGGNRYGDSVTYICNPGHDLTGDKTRVCQADEEWKQTYMLTYV